VLFILARIARDLTDQRARFGIALVSGGALGNLGDRIAYETSSLFN
jgi:lipoprotein signal peptidase